MDLYGRADLPYPPDLVYAAVADLSTYTGWLGIIVDVAVAAPHPADAGPAWLVELGARLGPVRRSKRVRMVRTEDAPPSRARFERQEHDGAPHSAWVLTATIDADADPGQAEACRLRMDLHYGGAGWLPGLDLLLRQEIRRAGSRLSRYLQQ